MENLKISEIAKELDFIQLKIDQLTKSKGASGYSSKKIRAVAFDLFGNLSYYSQERIEPKQTRIKLAKLAKKKISKLVLIN